MSSDFSIAWPLALFYGWLAVAVTFLLLWRWSVTHRNVGIVDVGWAYTLGAWVLWYAFVLAGDDTRQLLFALATGFWAVRLGTFILRRMRAEEAEDARYAFLRQYWGAQATWKFLYFFQGQGIANLLLTAPIMLLMLNPAPLTIWDWLGATIIVGSVLLERQADNQLAVWKKDPAHQGQTCRAGWWAVSRHPNYFFEWCHWLAYPVAGIALWGTSLAAWWPLTLLGPVVMFALLVRGTGIPYTEKRSLKSRGDDYRKYQAEVSSFFPWPTQPAPKFLRELGEGKEG